MPTNKRIRSVAIATLTTISAGLLLRSLLPSALFWIFWEVVGAVLVAYGCAGEWYWISWKDPPRRESFVLYSAFEEKKTKWEKLFAIVVAVGVAMEAIGLTHSIPEGLKLARDVENLKSANAALFTIGEKAKESAARATEEAERAKTEREKAESGRLVLEQQVLVAQSNLAALQLQVQWRTITAEQQATLIKRLRPLAVELLNGEKEITVRSIGDNPEARQFASRIAFAMTASGFNVYLDAGLTMGFRQGVGVFLGVKDKNRPPRHAVPVLHAFEELKIGPLSVVAKDGEVIIVVLPKPEN